jgi:hypothetical protein
MKFPSTLLDAFSAAKATIKNRPWFRDSWSCCSGLWQPEKYGDTVLLRMSKSSWSSVYPISLEKGAEIQYAAWIDQKLFERKELRFEMHLFSFPPGYGKIKKGDFTDPFRRENKDRIRDFGHHDTKRGPAVPYAGAWQFSDPAGLTDFLVKDFCGFASLAPSVDKNLQRLSARKKSS